MDLRTGLPVVGMVGAGQLARMTHQAAIPLGLSLRLLAEHADDGAALVAHDVVVGAPDDADAVSAFAAGCDVVTFDHEHVPTEVLRRLVAEGRTVLPGPDSLTHAQDKLVMRRRLSAAGVPCPRWAPVSTPADIEAFAAEVGWPVVLKAARGGYDGKGVWVLDSAEQAGEPLASGTPLLVEQRVRLRRELAAVVARSPFGQAAAWPVVQTVQLDGICVEVIAPAPDLAEETAVAAQELALKIAGDLEVAGVLAVELFETDDGLAVNELAMRPHNSAHWTIEGSRTSQFEQHLRAVLDYPLGDTSPTAPVTVMANLLGGETGGTGIDERVHHLFAADPAIKIHLYGKQIRPGRKIGHVTALGDDVDTTRRRATSAVDYLRTGQWPGEEPTS